MIILSHRKTTPKQKCKQKKWKKPSYYKQNTKRKRTARVETTPLRFPPLRFFFPVVLKHRTGLIPHLGCYRSVVA